MAGVVLGLDGKDRALQASLGIVAPSAITTLYVGLLATLPANHDGLDLATLLGGNEHTATGSWYTGGRKAVDVATELSAIQGDHDGRYVTVSIELDWPNTSGADEDIAGVFVTNVQSGTSGLSLWVGPPDIGGQVAADGGSAKIVADGLTLRID